MGLLNLSFHVLQDFRAKLTRQVNGCQLMIKFNKNTTLVVYTVQYIQCGRKSLKNSALSMFLIIVMNKLNYGSTATGREGGDI